MRTYKVFVDGATEATEVRADDVEFASDENGLSPYWNFLIAGTKSDEPVTVAVYPYTSKTYVVS